MHHIHKLIYRRASKMWHAYDSGKYCCPIHHGDYICIRVQDRYFPATVKLDTNWYLLVDHVKFYLHPEQRYDAILMF